MRTHCPVVLLILLATASAAQPAAIAPPAIQWQKTFGGTDDDHGTVVRETPDGGYIIGGTSYSLPGGNKTSENFGNADFWVLRLDAAGNKIWENTYGGHLWDGLADLQPTEDGRFILAGRSESPANYLKRSPSFGGWDYWLIKVDASGNVLWDRTYGGKDGDSCTSVAVLSDGGFLLVGNTSSQPGGNKTSPLIGGPEDCWVVRTDSKGNMVWDRSYGGKRSDSGSSVAQLADGGFLVCGDSSSQSDANKSSPALGASDVWLTRLDPDGNLLWDTAYGGEDNDRHGLIRMLPGSDFAFIASSDSQPGPFKRSASFGGGDYWLVRLATDGTRLWDKSFGGSGIEYALDLQRTSDGGFVVCGKSGPGEGGNKIGPGFGRDDGWVVRLDAGGNLLWQMPLGGDSFESIRSIKQARDGGFILVGDSFSGVSGSKAVPGYGSYDVWVIKLGPDALTAGGAASPAVRQRELPHFGGAAAQPPVRYTNLALKSISGTASRRFALLNDQTLSPGETLPVKLLDGKVNVRCIEVREQSVIVAVQGEKGTREINLRQMKR